MPKVCFIGNSHVAALKLAWDDTRDDYPDISADMFGARALALNDAALIDGRLAAATESLQEQFEWTGGAPAISLSEYSAFYLIAGSVNSFAVFDLYSMHHYHELSGRHGRPLSEAVFRRAALARLRTAPAARIARLIRQASDAPIHICPQALPSDACLNDPQCDIPHKLAVANGDAEMLLQMCDRLFAEVAASVGATVEPQPEETRSATAFTASSFSEGSVKLTKGLDLTHPQCDYRHMNRRYGAAVLSRLLAAYSTPASRVQILASR